MPTIVLQTGSSIRSKRTASPLQSHLPKPQLLNQSIGRLLRPSLLFKTAVWQRQAARCATQMGTSNVPAIRARSARSFPTVGASISRSHSAFRLPRSSKERLSDFQRGSGRSPRRSFPAPLVPSSLRPAVRCSVLSRSLTTLSAERPAPSFPRRSRQGYAGIPDDRQPAAGRTGG